MGIDLTVLPIKHVNFNWWLGHERLRFDRDPPLFDAILKLTPIPIPREVDFQNYEDEGLESTREDRYGRELTYLLAGQFRPVLTAAAEYRFGNSDWNLAVLRFLNDIHPSTPTVLLWS